MQPPIRFVLLEPRIAENVGAAARVLKNFGWTDWAVVEPDFEDWGPAHRMAVQAEDTLLAAKRPADLESVTSDCIWVVGTSSRRRHGQRSLSPREVASLAAERAQQGPVALVFGDERSGLTNDTLDRCHDVATIATDERQPSINLAQAICLFAYETRLAVDGPPEARRLPEAATSGSLQFLERALQASLEASGFLRDSRDAVMRRFMAPLVRARLTRSEATLWSAAFRSLGRR